MTYRSLAAGLALILTGALVAAAPPAVSGADHRRATLTWGQCPDDIPGVPVDPVVQCAALRLPVDWSRPRGVTFDLAVARRPARDQAKRVGSLVFGPGGPGDSGVERVRRGDRFSDELLDKFDIVSFDPRGVGRSAAPRCSPSPTLPKPPLLLGSQADFDATIAYNQALWANCRPTSPVFDHADTLSTVHDLDAIRRALGESRLTFHGSSYGTLLGAQYAERFPHRVRAVVLEGVFDHSLDVPSFVRSQAATLQDSFDEFVAWCDRSTDCLLHGTDVRAIWADVLARADGGEYAPSTAFDITVLPLGMLNVPRWTDLAQVIKGLSGGVAPAPRSLPVATAVFCADWPVRVRDYDEYATLVRLAAAAAPDVRYGAGLIAVQTCLGWPTPVRNPPHELRVTGNARLLLLNALHDPRTGYEWATNVAEQLGKRGRLLTYEGWGHGSYQRTACTIGAVDRYLVDLVLPEAGARCPAA
ncbi:alpha/beta fold hydrolase [Micromonospora sp. NPDC001898]|uniref:alpha/beta fold hydrolase n=1 Tax=Micromonospora sp. NPDC001898 TaxID=3364221 RepID=UPI0036970FF2